MTPRCPSAVAGMQTHTTPTLALPDAASWVGMDAPMRMGVGKAPLSEPQILTCEPQVTVLHSGRSPPFLLFSLSQAQHSALGIRKGGLSSQLLLWPLTLDCMCVWHACMCKGIPSLHS